MRSKLLVVAIAAGLGFSSLVSAAPATKTTKASATSATTNAEIEMLKAQLAAMQSKINELE